MAKKKTTRKQTVKSEVVRKSNIFVDGRYRFGLREQKILLTIISKIKTDQNEFIPYRVLWNDIKSLSPGNLDSVAKINKACESLKNKTIAIKKGRTVDNFGFLSGWKTYVGKYVEFRIDPSMKEMLLGLLEDGNFTLYNLECALALPSPTSVRIYEILKSHAWKKQPVTIPLDDLKISLDIDLKSPTYTNYSNFRLHVLEKSKKNLLKYTDIRFNYKPIKESRTVVAVSFTISENKKFQRTVTAAVQKDLVKPGDTIIIGGKDYEVNDGGCYYRKGAIPIGQINELLKIGKAKIKND